MKKLISFILCVVMLASLACLGASAATEGTAINTAEEFAAMKADGTYYLNADIAINATYMEPFTGTFDGNGHTVTITVPMFAQFDGTVKDLTIDGVELSGAENLAAFAVYSQYMTAINVTNKVDITVTGITTDASGDSTGLYAGGIVAHSWKDTDCMIVLRSCKNYGKITVASDSTTSSDGKDPTTYAGGIAGLAYGLDAKFCENYGDIDAFASANGNAGGIVGGAAKSNMITTSHIEFCTSEANIKAGSFAGGIMGTVGASGNETMDPYTIKYCTSIGDITGSYEAGGLLGYAYATSGSTGAYIEVTNSIFVGTVYGGRASTNSSGSAQYAYSSLLVAYSNSCFNTVQNCLAWGEIKTLEGETFGDNHAKGFMGCSSAKTPDMPIENVFLCDNNTTEWYSWASATKNDDQKIKLEEYLGTKINRCTEDEIKSGAILTKLNTYAGEDVFVQKKEDLYPTINPALVAEAQKRDSGEYVDDTTTAAAKVSLQAANLEFAEYLYLWAGIHLEGVEYDSAAKNAGVIFWREEQADDGYTYDKAVAAAAAGKAVISDVACAQETFDGVSIIGFPCAVAAKQMADVFYLQGYVEVDGKYYYSTVGSYSVTKYAQYQLYESTTASDELKDCLRAMLEYGAAAQKLFKYNTDNLANAINGEISEKVLAKFTKLKNTFLVTRKTWYTDANYATLSEIFEEAFFELYKTTTAEGVEALLAETEAKASAVTNIVSEANAVQALIAKLGYYQNLTTADARKVEAARAAFDKWVDDYAICFFAANGKTIEYGTDANGKKYIDYDKMSVSGMTGEQVLADFASQVTGGLIYINASANTFGLRYGEWCITSLYEYAEDTIRYAMVAQLMISGGKTQAEAQSIVDVLFDDTATDVERLEAVREYQTVKAVVDEYGVTYADCKANAEIIEEVYEHYRIFIIANGGDDSPIADSYGLLTGEQFVKLYVLCLYDGELMEYKKQVEEILLEDFVPFFMNTGNTSKLKSTYGWNYLSFNSTFAQGYDSCGYWSALNTTSASNVTFGVETDRIAVYVNGVENTSIKIDAHGEEIQRELDRALFSGCAQISALAHSTDFKGKKTLEEAFAEIDQIAAATVVDMVNVWYELVFTPYIETYSDNALATLKTDYGYSGSDVYAKHDNSFYTQVSDLIEAANDKLESIEFKTIEALGISNQRIFTTVYTNYVISGIEFNTTTGNKDASKNSAFVSIVNNAYKTIDAAILAYDNVLVDVAAAKTVHDTATAYAKELDELVGISNGKTGTNWDWKTGWKSQLIEDFGNDYKLVVGSDKYDVEAIYNSLTGARDEAVADILSVKLLNDDGTLAIDKETYAALNSAGKAWYNANSGTLSLTTTAKNNHAVQVIADPQVVAEYIMIEKFAKGGDAVILAFCDATRAIIKEALEKELEFWSPRYFGELDYVKLEGDMNNFIAYLNLLTDFAGVGSKFSTASFGLKNQAIASDAAGTVAVTKTSNKITTWYLHINAMAKDTDDITGLRTSTDKAAWYTMTKANLRTYFDIKNGDVVEKGMLYVRELSYIKDDLRNSDKVEAIQLKTAGKLYSSIGALYAKYTGTVVDGKFTVAPKKGYEYQLDTVQTALYLTRLAEVKAAVTEKVAAIDLLNSGFEDGMTPVEAYYAALERLEAIMDQYNNPNQQTNKATVTLDDYSLPIAYQRYYTTQYDWSNYRNK